MSQQSEFQIDYIYGKKVTLSKMGFQRILYGVKWDGFSHDQNSYEKETNFYGEYHIMYYEILQDFMTIENLSIQLAKEYDNHVVKQKEEVNIHKVEMTELNFCAKEQSIDPLQTTIKKRSKRTHAYKIYIRTEDQFNGNRIYKKSGIRQDIPMNVASCSRGYMKDVRRVGLIFELKFKDGKSYTSYNELKRSLPQLLVDFLLQHTDIPDLDQL